MEMLEKYNAIYEELFGEELEVIPLEELEYGEGGWDSVMSMDLLALFEQEFDIAIKNEDKMDFSSYQEGKEILEKYGIDFE